MIAIPLVFAAAAAAPMAVSYDCGGTAARASFAGSRLTLQLGGRTYFLWQVRSGSGVRYMNRTMQFRSKGDEATVTMGRRTLPTCRARPSFQPYRAVGQEPGWLLDIAADGRTAAFAYDYGQKKVADMLGPMIANPKGATVRKGARIEVRTFPGGCNDSMSGKFYAERVTVTAAGRKFDGCGGIAMGEIGGGEWTVETVGGNRIVDRSRVTLDVDGERIAGNAGCNRYSGRFIRDAAGITVGPMTSTEMACAPALMKQESRFLELLGEGKSYRVRADGKLEIRSGNGQTIVARHDR